MSQGLKIGLFAAALAMVGISTSALADDAPVSGGFKGNGKNTKLAYLSVRKGEPFADKPTIKLIFTEKDHSKEKRPDIKAMFGDFGSALLITIYEDGRIIGCEVVHTAHERMGFSSIGSINMTDFKMKDGKLSGTIKTKGEVKTFGQTWEVNIKFQGKSPN